MQDKKPKIRVYMVEDHPAIRETFRTFLQLEPVFEVVGEADSAEQAFKELPVKKADIVLMDIELPGLNGLQATKVLKEKFPGLVVVILTAYDEFGGQALEAGAEGYVTKYCMPEQLIEGLITVCRNQHLLGEAANGSLV